MHAIVNAAIFHNNMGCAFYRRGEKLKSRAAFQTASSILHPVMVWQWSQRRRNDSGEAIVRDDLPVTAGAVPVQLVEEQPDQDGIMRTIDHDGTMIRNPYNSMSDVAEQYNAELDEEQGDHKAGNEDIIISNHVPSSRFSEGLLVYEVITLPQVNHQDHCVGGNRTHNGSSSSPCVVRLLLTTAVIVMNLALTFVDESEPDAIHALALFESAYDLAIKEPEACDLTERVALISLNNATQLLNELGDLERTKEYADTLIRLIHCLPFSYDAAQREFRSRFMLNAMVLKAPIIAKAA